MRTYTKPRCDDDDDDDKDDDDDAGDIPILISTTMPQSTSLDRLAFENAAKNNKKTIFFIIFLIVSRDMYMCSMI